MVFDQAAGEVHSPVGVGAGYRQLVVVVGVDAGFLERGPDHRSPVGPIWNFRKLTAWTKTVAGLGFAGLHFHDLRHTGNTLAARSSVSTRDLMARMGHDSVRAAVIYQHATTAADDRIAAALEAELSGDDEDEVDDAAGPDEDEDGGASALVPAG